MTLDQLQQKLSDVKRERKEEEERRRAVKMQAVRTRPTEAAVWMLSAMLVIGVIDNLSASYVSAEYRQAIPMILLIVIILVRPQGIMGTSEGRTV